MYGDLFMEVFHGLADALDTRVASIVPAHAITLAPDDLAIRAGTIPRGTVASTDWRWRGRLESGVDVLHSVTWTADPAAPHMRAAVDATVAIAIQAIPAVCAAPAGFYAVPAFAPHRSRLSRN